MQCLAHRRKRRLHLPGLHADDLKASRLQAVGQALGERAGLEAYLSDLDIEIVEEGIDVRNFGVCLAFGKQLAVIVDDADVCGAQ